MMNMMMSDLQIALVALAGTGVFCVLLYAFLSRKIRRLNQKNKNLEYQNGVFSGIIRLANIKRVPPDELNTKDLED